MAQEQQQNQAQENDMSNEEIASSVMKEVRGGEPQQKPEENQNQSQQQKPEEKKPEETDPKKDEKKPDFSDLEIPDDVLGINTEEKKEEQQEKDKKTETEQDPEEIKNADKAVREAFAKMRLKLSQSQDELKKLQERPAEQQTGDVAQYQKQIEELNAKLNAAYDEVGKYSLEADPRFKQKHDVKRNENIESIKLVMKEFNIAEDVLPSILNATPKQRSEKINELEPDAWPVIAVYLTQYDRDEYLRKMELNKHQEIRQSLEAEQNTQKSLLTQQGKEMLFRAATAKVMSNGQFVFKKREGEGNEKWNEMVNAVQSRVQDLFTKDDPQAQAESLILGAAAPLYLGWFKKAQLKVIDLEKQLKDRYGVKPKLDGKVSTDTKKNDDDIDIKKELRGIVSQELGQ